MRRRTLLQSALAGFAGGRILDFVGPAAAQEGQPPQEFRFETLIQRAREMAAEPFERPTMPMQGPFENLTYDQFRAIRFRDDHRLFADAARGFQMDLMPPGFSFQDKVEIFVVRDGQVVPVAFSTDYFHFHPDYFPYPDGVAPSDRTPDMGFSGVRFRHPLNRPGVWDEVAVFQGASYLRAVARDTLYGLSARGLAIGIGGPEPEEFPLFRGFWITEPQPGDAILKMNALLDSQSIVGAYEFTIDPGDETVMRVRALLFPRADLHEVGLAPLTSMYFFGPESRAGIDDFRDAVHDSNGLWMVNGRGERLWRPLRNPSSVQSSAFVDENPRSFGLIQRFRDFEHFQDAEAHYERRPSAWVEPEGEWGRGWVMLYELPTGDEYTDNIAMTWKPEQPLRAGSEYVFSYRLIWGQTPIDQVPLARVLATRSGQSLMNPDERVFVVDFDLGLIDFDSVRPKVTVSAGEVRGLSIAALSPRDGGGNVARVGFHYLPAEVTEAEFRLILENDAGIASEIWLYRWTV